MSKTTENFVPKVRESAVRMVFDYAGSPRALGGGGFDRGKIASFRRRFTNGQAEPDRKALCIDNNVDLGREPAARSTETVIAPGATDDHQGRNFGCGGSLLPTNLSRTRMTAPGRSRLPRRLA